MAKQLFAAGEKTARSNTASTILKQLRSENDEMSLMAICRKSIRKYFLDVDPHQNLFARVPNFGLPAILTEYILFHWTLDVDEDKEDEDYYSLVSEDKDDDTDLTQLVPEINLLFDIKDNNNVL